MEREVLHPILSRVHLLLRLILFPRLRQAEISDVHPPDPAVHHAGGGVAAGNRSSVPHAVSQQFPAHDQSSARLHLHHHPSGVLSPLLHHAKSRVENDQGAGSEKDQKIFLEHFFNHLNRVCSEHPLRHPRSI